MLTSCKFKVLNRVTAGNCTSIKWRPRLDAQAIRVIYHCQHRASAWKRSWFHQHFLHDVGVRSLLRAVPSRHGSLPATADRFFLFRRALAGLEKRSRRSHLLHHQVLPSQLSRGDYFWNDRLRQSRSQHQQHQHLAISRRTWRESDLADVPARRHDLSIGFDSRPTGNGQGFHRSSNHFHFAGQQTPVAR